MKDEESQVARTEKAAEKYEMKYRRSRGQDGMPRALWSVKYLDIVLNISGHDCSFDLCLKRLFFDAA